MKTLKELETLAKTKYTLFFKYGCRYSKAAVELLEELERTEVIAEFEVLILGEDYTEEDITELCGEYGVEPQGYATKVSIPQIFMKGEYIGGNTQFYASRWNLGDDDSGIIELINEKGMEYSKKTPQKVNPLILE